jgi:hypothetical protein
MEGRERGYESSGSEEYGPAPKKQRKHKFKTFKQRINNVGYSKIILAFFDLPKEQI